MAQPMKPEMLSNYSEGLLAYQRDQVRIWRSGYRDELTTQAMEEIFADHLRQLGASPKDTPVLPKEAQLLAEKLVPAPEDYYAQAVKATAEGWLEDARTLLAKAEAQSQERASQAVAAKQHETEKQVQIYLARARMEMYAGRFTEAFSQYERAAKIVLDPMPELLNEMGLAGLQAGKYQEAESYFTRALKQREQNLAPDHPDRALSLNNLAMLYEKQGRYDKAEPLYQRALAIWEKALGPNHPNVAPNFNNLAELYRAQGQYAKAEPLYQRALAITEKALGIDHPDVARSLNNLAGLSYHQGQYAKAEPLFQRSFWIVLRSLGPEHPTVRKVFANYQTLLKASGQPHTENDVGKKLRSSKYAPTSKTTTP
ncbi:MAG: tetratricopeptide repeat protein [Nitrospira sp. CG24B]|nr:MAG: tetratricopeptide repeat protein [Nitrospira sp. CG24B]